MKTASRSLSVAVAVFAAAAFALTSGAQAPQTEPSAPPTGAPQHREFHIPPPKNLQVLPKDLTGEQVVHIMQGWAAALGTHCDTCHAPNPNAEVQPGQRARLDFSLDIKPEKNTARLMYKMVHDINTNYIAMVGNSGDSGANVSCGTCHRGHLSPPPFTPPERNEGPRPQGGQGSTPPPPPAPGL